ncbi:MAG: hypothetical protein ACKOCH_07340, partial [Bacteroidota bacterium]
VLFFDVVRAVLWSCFYILSLVRHRSDEYYYEIVAPISLGYFSFSIWLFLCFTKSKIASTATPIANPIAILREIFAEEIP